MVGVGKCVTIQFSFKVVGWYQAECDQVLTRVSRDTSNYINKLIFAFGASCGFDLPIEK